MSAASPPHPSVSPPPVSPTSPANGNGHHPDSHRRTSFGFLRRQKSTETRHNMLKKHRGQHQHPPQQTVPRVPPQLPAPSAAMDASFIGDSAQAQYGSSRYQVVPQGVPPSTAASGAGEHFDPYARNHHGHQHQLAASRSQEKGPDPVQVSFLDPQGDQH